MPFRFVHARACLLIIRRVRRRGMAFFAPLCFLAGAMFISIDPHFHTSPILDFGTPILLIEHCWWIWRQLPPPSLFPGSSFCYLNRAISGRGVLLPSGLSDQPSVIRSNLIGVRTTALFEVSVALDQEGVLEQPDHRYGLMHLPRWQKFLERHTLYRSKCKQGCYSAETEKPTALHSNHTKWALLRNSLSREDAERLKARGKELVSRKRDSSGKLRVTGKKEELKSTQSYTLDFGRALAQAWQSPCATWS